MLLYLCSIKSHILGLGREETDDLEVRVRLPHGEQNAPALEGNVCDHGQPESDAVFQFKTCLFRERECQDNRRYK